MKEIKELFAAVSERLQRLARSGAVVAKPISVGSRHVIPLCELRLGFGGGGGHGTGEADAGGSGTGTGTGGGAGGGAKATPVAVLVVEDGRVRLETLGH